MYYCFKVKTLFSKIMLYCFSVICQLNSFKKIENKNFAFFFSKSCNIALKYKFYFSKILLYIICQLNSFSKIKNKFFAFFLKIM